MFVSKNISLSHICKFKLIDENDKAVVDLEFTNKFDNKGSWVTRDIPEEMEIIGLSCNTEK